MQTAWQQLRLTLLCVVLFGVLYPLLIVVPAELVSPRAAAGTPLLYQGRVVGFENVGQPFVDSIHFWGRPSAVGYNAAATGGSNKGPTNPDYLAEVKTRLDAFLNAHSYLKAADVPSELITASGGGLDPHISPQAAQVQVRRVATARGLDPTAVATLVSAHTEGPALGLFGPSRINVLKLNLALESLR